MYFLLKMGKKSSQLCDPLPDGISSCCFSCCAFAVPKLVKNMWVDMWDFNILAGLFFVDLFSNKRYLCDLQSRETSARIFFVRKDV